MIKKNVTLTDIVTDIKEGKSSTIYYATNSLWWTHDENDLEQSTSVGKIKLKELLNKYEKPFNDSSPIPLCPLGSPLLMTDDPLDFIEFAEKNYNINAFISAHHKNCRDENDLPFAFNSIEEYITAYNDSNILDFTK